jgi:hypothetical protein
MKVYTYRIKGTEADEMCFLKPTAGLRTKWSEDIEDKLQFNNITCKVSDYRNEWPKRAEWMEENLIPTEMFEFYSMNEVSHGKGNEKDKLKD